MLSHPTRFLLLFTLWSATLAVSAQKPLIARQPPAVSEYVLGAGDQVSLHIVDLEDVTEKPIRIDPNGFIDLPLVGRVEAGGLTIEQLREQLRAKFSKYITSPQISINLIDNQSRSVSVIGSVNNPGVRALEGPRRLIEVISLAGGVRADAGSRVIVTRQARWGELPLTQAKMDPTGSYSTATISLESLLSAGNPSENILVDPGDVVSIPKADIVYVVGTVKKAGGFPLASKDSMSLIQTLSLAEGLDQNAAANKARILRPSPGGDGPVHEIPVDIPRVFSGKDPDVALYANDVLYVPNSLAKSALKQTAATIVQVATGVIIYRR